MEGDERNSNITGNSLEAYMNSLITRNDLKYIGNVAIINKILSLGYRTSLILDNENDFSSELGDDRDSHQQETIHRLISTSIFSRGLFITDPFLKELQIREKANSKHNILTVIFLLFKSRHGLYSSAYIDYQDSLQRAHKKTRGHLNWRAIFEGKKKLVAKTTDLSFFCSETKKLYTNNTTNFEAFPNLQGLELKCKRDRRAMVITSEKTDKNLFRTVTISPIYGWTVLYDHVVCH